MKRAQTSDHLRAWPELWNTSNDVAGHGHSASLLEVVQQMPLRQRGPVLRLANRSKQLKLFIYATPQAPAWSADDLASRFPRCKSFQWSGDWELIERVRKSPHLTLDGSTADFYLVPFLSKCYFNHVAHYRLEEMDKALLQA